MKLSDVTLREGDQLPNRDFGIDEKIESARALDDLGLDYIQAGFPVTGTKDKRVLSELAGTTNGEIIGLARALEGDIDAVVDTDIDIVELFVSVSDRHLEHLLGKSREEMHAMLGTAVEYAHGRGAEVHVTLADAFRTDPETILAVDEAIPTVPFLTLADTVGARTPRNVRKYLDTLAEHVDLGRIGVHFHDDLDCATANALVAADAGVGKTDVSVAGLGERAGNSPLESVVAAASVDDDLEFEIEESDLIPTCRGVLEILGEDWDDRRAVLGGTVHEHESAIHTTAMLSDPATMEAYNPARFGAERHLVFGASTGTSGIRKLLDRAGVEVTDDTIAAYTDTLANHGPLDLDEALSLARKSVSER